MKVSVSARPEETHNSQGSNSPIGNWLFGNWALRSSPWPVAGIAAAYLVAHLPSLAPSLEDYDSINFALGLRDFDPARHQPHPPGSPVYIALGRALLAIISLIWPSLTESEVEALTLALWSAVAGVVALVALAHILAAVSSRRSEAVWTTAIVAACPL